MVHLNGTRQLMLRPLALVLTSTVTVLMPAGFHRFCFQPSTHIAPRLSNGTVPSPSPSLTPFFTYSESD